MAENATERFSSMETEDGRFAVVQADRVLYPQYATRSEADARAAELNGIRPLSAIAEEIQGDWKRPYFGAVPYLSAMADLDSIEGDYYADSAASVVRYFLSNAGTWRGETARRVKAELKAMLPENKH